MSNITEKERRAIIELVKITINCVRTTRANDNVIIGAIKPFIDEILELRNAEKPSGDLVAEIEKIFIFFAEPFAAPFQKTTHILHDKYFNIFAKEIANLLTQREAELLEAAKDALATFYGVGCTDEADIVQALKKAISKYQKP